ncbi:MAG: DegV family protein [Oscillospiraceae bacterium]|nr:DegV family protein [Oscillospiraceae bacterium]
MIRIITDSTSDLSRERAHARGIRIVPLTVHFGEEAFRDGEEISNAEFYARLATAESLPTTSQVTPSEFTNLFQSYINEGDEIIGIFISSEMSGTCQSAEIARQAVDPDHIYIIDSRTVTFPLGLLVEEAAAMRDTGLPAAEIAAAISALTRRIRLLSVLDTLKYLKMGGRISAATAVVGGILGITPLVGIIDGKVESIGKTRGRRAAFQWMSERLKTEPIDFNHRVCFGHSDFPEAMAECMEFFKTEVAGVPEILTSDMGAVVGTHAGPKATGLAYFVKESTES